MKVVWKYPLDPNKDKPQSIWMPGGSQVLDVQLQGYDAVIWALVDPERVAVERRFILVWTGEERDDLDMAGYVGTFQAGHTVWHLFEEL